MFSVVIPLFNKKPYIRRCVESVLRQSYSDFELIVVDDGSTDDGLDELVNIVDPRLIILRQNNSGVSAARNAGVRMAKGDWVSFVDGDDFWLSNHLEELKYIIVLNLNVGLVSTSYVERFEGEEVPLAIVVPGVIARIDYFIESAKKIGIICASTAAVKRSVFNEVGGFRKYALGEDQELWARLALDYPVALSSKVTAVYIRGTGGAMDSFSSNNINCRKFKLVEIFPAISLLITALEVKKYLTKRDSIIKYINSRVFIAIRGALYRGHVSDAKSYFKMSMSPLSTQLRYLKVFFLFPDFFICFLLALIRMKKLIKEISLNWRFH